MSPLRTYNKTKTQAKQKKYLTSLEISEIRVSLSSYCSFKMPSNRASASTDLKKKTLQSLYYCNCFVGENNSFVKVTQFIGLVCNLHLAAAVLAGNSRAIRLTDVLATVATSARRHLDTSRYFTNRN